MPGKMADAKLAPNSRLSHALAAMGVRIGSMTEEQRRYRDSS